MVLTKDEKEKIIKSHHLNSSDTGSPEVQIAVMTSRIEYLTQHLSTHKKDFHSRIGLMKMVGRRKRLLEYIKKQDVKRYENLVKKLKLRK